MKTKIEGLKIVLGSGSPRRKQLLEEVGFNFTVRTKEIDETPPAGLQRENIAIRLAEMKAEVLIPTLAAHEILVTADTIVCFNDLVLNKPKDAAHAFEMLKTLNGKTHQVYTGVAIVRHQHLKSFAVKTDVLFNNLSDDEIRSYIEKFQPFDKAGSYGAQESLPVGMNPCSVDEINFLQEIKKPELFQNTLSKSSKENIPLIKEINGSYFNVMGLPIRELTLALLNE